MKHPIPSRWLLWAAVTACVAILVSILLAPDPRAIPDESVDDRPQLMNVRESSGIGADSEVLAPADPARTASTCAAPVSGPAVSAGGSAPAAVDAGVMKSIHQQIREAQYFFTPANLAGGGQGFRAPNPAHKMEVMLGGGRLELAAAVRFGEDYEAGDARPEPDWLLSMRPAGGSPHVRPVVDEARVEVRHPDLGLTEWYENRPDGLEQGFTLERPQGRDDEVRVRLEVETTLSLRSQCGCRDEISFVDRDGLEQLQYRKLQVFDAMGRTLPARMEVADGDDGSILVDLVADARGAAYPVTIDPLFTHTSSELSGPDGGLLDQNGLSIAVTQTHLAVGARNHGSMAGAVYLFQRNSDGTWSYRQKLTALDSTPDLRFGTALVLSLDRLVVGAPQDPPSGAVGPGAVYIFEPDDAGSWAQEQKLTSATAVIGDGFGIAVEYDEDTIVVGAPRDDVGIANNQGSAYVFTRPSGSSDPFTQLTTLTLAGMGEQALFGLSLSLEGADLYVGAPGFDGSQGLVCQFHRDAGGPGAWGEVDQISAATPTALDAFGIALDLIEFGEQRLLIVGAPGRDGGRGAVDFVNYGEIVGGLSLADGEVNDYFGFSVSGKGQHLAVGVPQRNGDGINNRGMVVLYTSSFVTAYTEIGRICPGGMDAGSQFGYSVAIDGGLLAGGAPFYDYQGDNDRGSGFVYQIDGGTWAQCGGLPGADDLDPTDSFGVTIAIDRGVMVVGAPKDRDPGSGETTGAAFVFYRSGSGSNEWYLRRRLDPTPGIVGALFGQSVDVSGDTVAVGAPGVASAGLAGSGAVYIYRRNHLGADNWGELWAKNASPAQVDAMFGHDVSLCNDHLVVGAPMEDTPEADRGAAYVFDRNQGAADGWDQTARLTGSVGGANDQFGTAVAIDGETVVVGAPYHDAAEGGSTYPDGGAVFIFNRNVPAEGAWGELAQLKIPGEILSASRAQFGRAVALDGATVAASTRGRGIFIYRRNAGGADQLSQVAQVLPSAGAATTFGAEIALCGARLAVNGADAADFNGIFIFQRNLGGEENWGQSAQLASSRGDHFTGGLGFDGEFVAGAATISSSGRSFAAVFHHQNSFISVPAYPLTSESELLAEENLGLSVDLTDDFLIAGAPGEASGRGAAYLFKRNHGGADAWGRVVKLNNPSSLVGNMFGSAVAISYDHAVATEPFADSPGAFSGRAQVFERNEDGADAWGLDRELVASDAIAREWFGVSADIDGDLIIVGAPAAGDPLTKPGQAYVFERNHGGGWGERGILSAASGSNGWFGSAVALSGDTAVVGAASQLPDGSAYIFERNAGGSGAWGEVAELVAPVLGGGAGAGLSVAIDGPVAVVGAPLYGAPVDSFGAVLVYQKNLTGADGWGLMKTITTGALDGESFGTSVAVRGDRIAAGAPNSEPGRVYLYERNIGGRDNWGLMGDLWAGSFPDGGPVPREPEVEGYVVRDLDDFGRSVAMSDNFIAVGAPDSSIVHFDGTTFGTERALAGAVFVYRPVSHFRTWLLNNHLVGDISDRSFGNDYYLGLDPEGDGFSHVLEYLMALDPRSFDSHEEVMPVFIDHAAGEFVLRYPRAKYAPDGGLVVKWSRDLQNWFSSGETPPPGGGPARSVSEEIVDDLGDALLIEARVSLVPFDSRLFLRLEAENIRAF